MTTHHVKEVQCVWNRKKTELFWGHYLSNDSNSDTDVFRHINVN